MRIFVDTNVLLDVFRQRMPYYADSVKIWTLAETNQVEGFISAISYNNCFYIVQNLTNKAAAQKAVTLLRDTFETVRLDQKILNQAIDANFKDFEDSIQYFSAIRSHANCIVTRNTKHFKNSDIPAYSPEEFLSLL